MTRRLGVVFFLALLAALPLAAKQDQLCGYQPADFETPKTHACFGLEFELNGKMEVGLFIAVGSQENHWKVLAEGCRTLILRNDQIVRVAPIDCGILTAEY